MSSGSDYVRPLAELAVQLGANVQPGQVVLVVSEPGKEPLARAVAEAAYERGAKFVDMYVFTSTSSAPACFTRLPTLWTTYHRGWVPKCWRSASIARRALPSADQWPLT